MRQQTIGLIHLFSISYNYHVIQPTLWVADFFFPWTLDGGFFNMIKIFLFLAWNKQYFRKEFWNEKVKKIWGLVCKNSSVHFDIFLLLQSENLILKQNLSVKKGIDLMFH